MNQKPAPQQKAPSGQWGMPADMLAAALGHFVMAWSSVEAVIEVAIKKQLRLKPLESSVVTAGLQFKARCSILMSLLNREPEKYADAIAALKAMKNIQDRNDILHSVIGGSKTVIWFNRRRTDDTFKSKIEKYDCMRLWNAALQCGDLSTALMKALKITKRDYLAFFHTAHNAANKL
jgi:hypothetical protein